MTNNAQKKTRNRANGDGTIYTTQRAKGTYYKASLVIGYDECGKPIRPSKGSYKRKDVVQWLQEMSVKRDSNALPQNDKLTLSQCFYNWLYIFQINNLKPSTFERYDGLYRNYIKDSDIGRKQLVTLSGVHLQQYYNALLSSGTSVDTIKNINNRIKTCLNEAINLKYITQNPCLAVKIPRKDHNPDKAINVFTQEEQLTFLQVNAHHHHGVLFNLAFASGLRQGELLALKWDYVDFEHNTVTVRQTVSNRTQIDASGARTWKFIVTSPKTKSSYRTVSVPIKVMNMLKQHKHTQELIKQKIGDLYEDNDLVFATNVGGYINTRNLTRSYERAMKKADISYKPFHSIRHTYATRLFEVGVPIKTVQALLGHGKIATTMDIYTHVMPEKLCADVEKLNDLF